MPWSQYLEAAIAATRAAGIHARNQQGTTAIEYKSGDQIVTEIDRQCQKMIVDAIRKVWPDHGFIGEEGEDGRLFKIPPSGSDSLWWVIDPIDGTRNYAHGSRQYAVSVGAIHNGVPVIGVVFDPCTDMLFAATKDEPPTCNGKPIHATSEPFDGNSQLGVASTFPSQYGPSLLHLYAHYTCMNLGSAALHYAYVANGSYAGAFAWEVKLWDIAAGCVLNQAAGAVISDFHGNPLSWDCHAYTGEPTPIVVAPPYTHEILIDIFQMKK